ncbi:thiol:disulfide interchange protein DsbA/DsbL [Luteimonas marina]|uniref:Thiol:disulfide interchange protein n=1 Tax=Luteimonas marina TaxID=488485 RepID=A0A5C5TZT9_9GAMM|nr:thiol:disulfide interchange protein DsbA/DsbL [Luteimonas marina]TWT19246.1 thiol:disulfide interchange protein DsbA/DsbL [Luteimonas marina]
MIRRLLALGLLLLLPLSAAAQQPAPVEGRDYVRIEGGQRWKPEPGTVEVVEIFAYSCGHCDQFRPMLDAWKRTAGKDVRVHYLPAAYSPDDAYARGYFALEALGRVAQVHPLLFDAIHREYSLPARGASGGEMAGFLAAQGLDAAKVHAAMASPATDEKMNAAREFAVRSGLQGTPTLIINGKYRVLGRTLGDSLRIADGLIAMERAVSR